MYSRRSFLTTAVAAPALLTAMSLRAQQSAPTVPVPTVYLRPLGERDVFTLLDGAFALGEDMVTNMGGDTYDAALRASYRDPDQPVGLGISVHLIRDGDRLTLVDTGAGAAFGPASGRLAAALEAIDIAPASISEVLLTHMHPDHIGGMIASDVAVFPNATVRVSATDFAFWTNGEAAAQAPESAQNFFRLAERVGNVYGDNIEIFDGDADLGRGVSSVRLPGHTPGHSGFRLDDGDASLFIIGDAAAVAALQFTHPDAGVSFDVDGEAAVQTRRDLFDMAAQDRLLIAGSHLPFPGFGHVERKNDAFAWVPEEWTYD